MQRVQSRNHRDVAVRLRRHGLAQSRGYYAWLADMFEGAMQRVQSRNHRDVAVRLRRWTSHLLAGLTRIGQLLSRAD